jgi:hypothetical protein
MRLPRVVATGALQAGTAGLATKRSLSEFERLDIAYKNRDFHYFRIR